MSSGDFTDNNLSRTITIFTTNSDIKLTSF